MSAPSSSSSSSSPPPPAKRPRTTSAQSSLTSFFKAAKPSTTHAAGMQVEYASSNPATTTPTAASAEKSTKKDKDIDSDPLAPIIPRDISSGKPWTGRWVVYDNACIYRKDPNNQNNQKKDISSSSRRRKIAAFDLDGTLLEWRISGWPSTFAHYELWNTSVITKLQDLYDNQNYQLIIFSNQGAIRKAFEKKKATFVKSLLEWFIATINRPVSVVMSTDKKEGYHKPAPLMWTQVANQMLWGSGKKNKNDDNDDDDDFDVDLENSFYVGDSVGGEDDPQGGVDVEFAKNVNVYYSNKKKKSKQRGAAETDDDAASTTTTLKFYTPTQFFGPSHQALRSKQAEAAAYETPSPTVLQTRAALTGGYLHGPILLMLCGAQGSGKSTFCQHLLQEENGDDSNNNKISHHWVHLSQDTIRNGKAGKREHVEEAAKQALGEGKSVVIDRMHLDELQREHFVKVAQQSGGKKNSQEAGVPVHVVVLTPPKDVLAQRVQNRENHAVSGPAGAKMAVKSAVSLKFPSYEEGIDLISASGTVEGAAKIVQLYRNVRTASSNEAEIVPKSLAACQSVDKKADVAIIPAITLGTMGLGKKTAQDVVSLACKLGFEAFDTAPTYKNEEKVGAGISSSDAAFCIVKVPKRATTPEQVRQELNDSLTQLKRKSADLLLLHWPCDVIAANTLKDVWHEMEKLVQEGLVKNLGVCNFNAQALGMLLPHCIQFPPVVNQVERHPLCPQWELVDFCAKKDIIVQAHTPLGQGKSDLLEHDVVKKVATQKNLSPAQVVLQWNLQQGVAVVPKCSTQEHMEQVLALIRSNADASKSLSAADMKLLNEVSEKKRFVAPPFMYGKEPYCWGRQAPK